MKKIILLLTIVAAVFTACDPENGSTIDVEKELFSGYAQKGPFVVGSSVMISELKTNLDQTGKIYSTNIIDGQGAFEQKNIELISNYVELKIDGYYFNEVTEQTSNAPITLYALADIGNVNSANVNVLTHLERPRVEYLVNQGGSFHVSKLRAYREILGIFGFEPEDATTSECLNITTDAILLAISSIFQGYMHAGEMMELMANISADIKTDGVLNNYTLGTKLVNNAYSILNSLDKIRDNLTEKYSEMGNDIIIPDFESYITSFINDNLYEQTLNVIYPSVGEYGENILSDDVISITANYGDGLEKHTYSMKAEVPEGLSLKIVIKSNLNKYVSVSPEPVNWSYDNELQEFIVKKSGKISDLNIMFDNSNNVDNPYITIEYYESESATPTKVRNLDVITSIFYTDYERNIISKQATLINIGEEYYMLANVPTGANLKVILKDGKWNAYSNKNWQIEDYDHINRSQEFHVIETGIYSDMNVWFTEGTFDEATQSHYITVEIYEYDAVTPTITKRLVVK